MPAVLSRTHAPRRTTPVASSCTGVRVAWAVVPSRMYSMSRGDVPFCWAISLTSATRSMACPPMRRRTSPGCSPQSRAGQTPFFTSDKPTISTPSVRMATPSACPPGISRFSGLTSTSTRRSGMPRMLSSSSDVPLFCPVTLTYWLSVSSCDALTSKPSPDARSIPVSSEIGSSCVSRRDAGSARSACCVGEKYPSVSRSVRTSPTARRRGEGCFFMPMPSHSQAGCAGRANFIME